MQSEHTVKHLVPVSLGHFKRFATLFILIALCVSGVAWFIFKQEQDSILNSVETRLWTEARLGLSAITMWYAPVRQEGLNLSQSDLVRLFSVEAAAPAKKLPADQLERQRDRLEVQRAGMVGYLQRQAQLLGLSQARLVDLQGMDSAAYMAQGAEAQASPDPVLVAAAAKQGFVLELPARESPVGPLLDIVFPVYMLNTDRDAVPMLSGALVFTVPLSGLLRQWLAVSRADQRSLILEKRADTLSSVEPLALVAHTWRGSGVLPGIKVNAAPGEASSMGQVANSGARNEVWRITRYMAPAFGGTGKEEVLGVGMRVPIIEHWYVVMETPFAPVALAMEKALHKIILWSVFLGGCIYALFMARWWWMDGRLHSRLHEAAHVSSTMQYKDRYLLEALSSIMPAPLYATNVQGLIKYANDAFALLLGKDRQSLYECNIAETLPSVKSLQYAQYDSELFKTKATTMFTDSWPVEHDKALNFVVTKKALCMPDGQIYGIMTLLQGTGPDAYALAHQKAAQGEATVNVSEHTPSTNTVQQKLEDA